MSFEQISAEETVTVPKAALQELMQMCEGAIDAARSGGMGTILSIVSLILIGISGYFIGHSRGSDSTAKNIMYRQIAEEVRED